MNQPHMPSPSKSLGVDLSDGDKEEIGSRPSKLTDGTYWVRMGDFNFRKSQNKGGNTYGQVYGLIEGTVLKNCGADPTRGDQPGKRFGISKFPNLGGFYETFKPFIGSLVGLNDPNDVKAPHIDALASNAQTTTDVVVQVTAETIEGKNGPFQAYENWRLIDDNEVAAYLASNPNVRQSVMPQGTRTERSIPHPAQLIETEKQKLEAAQG